MGDMTGVGLALTAELRSVIDAILALPQHQQPTIASSVAMVEDSASLSPTLSHTLSTSPNILLERVQETKRKLLSSHTDMTNISSSNIKLAVRAAIKYDALSATSTFSLEGLDALKFLIDNSSTTSVDNTRLYTELEAAIRAAGLTFTTNNNATSTTKSIEVEKRRERLRMLDEERSYGKLTRNLQTHSILKDDDITTKSMMYASSVGLNMIVAPISFGVFMYFFAGGIFGRFVDGEQQHDNIINYDRWKGGVDVRRVIVGVISGVFMLFVEMILFVIRSHELDAEVARKGRRRENRANPFGYTQKSMARVYVRDD
jgi:hypothetical protein